MKKVISIIILFFLSSALLLSQTATNNDGSAPHPSAMLDVKSGNKGFLLPRMTQVGLSAIINPVDGLQVFCIDCGANGLGAIVIFMAGTWYPISIDCMNPVSPLSGAHVAFANQIFWNWTTVTDATGYRWNTTSDFASAIDMGTAISKTETNLTCNTAYTRYAWAYSACGNSNPVTLTQTTLLNPPSTPTAGTNVPAIAQIVWNWNTVSGATGYKWNTANDFALATDMLTATTKTETNLTCNTAYTRYAWA
ncbi:MAG: hypothetical protein WCK09_03300, partial [Bacteroidota bacterium]